MGAFNEARAVELDRSERQRQVHAWCVSAFGDDHARSVQQRGIRLVEEAIEAGQAAGCDVEMVHRLVDHVFNRPAGELRQELGGVGVTLLALAQAAQLDAELAERGEISRILALPLAHFAARNAAKNAAGFNVVSAGPDAAPEARALPQPAAVLEWLDDTHRRQTEDGNRWSMYGPAATLIRSLLRRPGQDQAVAQSEADLAVGHTQQSAAPHPDAARLDYLQRNRWTLEPYGLPTPGPALEAVGWRVFDECGDVRIDYACVERDDVRAAIDDVIAGARAPVPLASIPWRRDVLDWLDTEHQAQQGHGQPSSKHGEAARLIRRLTAALCERPRAQGDRAVDPRAYLDREVDDYCSCGACGYEGLVRLGDDVCPSCGVGGQLQERQRPWDSALASVLAHYARDLDMAALTIETVLPDHAQLPGLIRAARKDLFDRLQPAEDPPAPPGPCTTASAAATESA